jgi:ABC-type ATPase involved in cell division
LIATHDVELLRRLQHRRLELHAGQLTHGQRVTGDGAK